jgi:hypothetical protein
MKRSPDVIRDPRDLHVRDLTGQIDLLGIFVLIVLDRMFPEAVKTARLAFMARVSDPRKTLLPALDTLETYGYATHIGALGSESWIITTYGQDTLRELTGTSRAASTATLPSVTQPALLPASDMVLDHKNGGKNLSAADRSYSSIDRSSIDRSDRSSIIEEDVSAETEKISAPISSPASSGGSREGADRLQAVAAWCDQHRVTGDKRERVLRDPWCTPDRLDAWLTHWTREGQTAKGEPFRSKWGPLNYAITCCLNHDDPPAAEAAEEGLDDESETPAGEPEKISVQTIQVSAEHAQIWARALGELQLEMINATYETWVKPCILADVTGDCWTIAARDRLSLEFLRVRLHSTIYRILCGLTGGPVTIIYLMSADIMLRGDDNDRL